MNEAVPSFVKNRYSPKESWKDKPFGRPDALFFLKGIQELSDLFTDERPKKIPAYFQHPKFRSSYLLYFLPLQAAKFVTLFKLHPEAVSAALRHGAQQKVLRIADLGAGPATASLAFLLQCLEEKTELPPIEIHAFDTNPQILEDGKSLVELLASHFPKLRGKVSFHGYREPWWQAADLIPGELSLVLLGHMLNEAGRPRGAADRKRAHEDIDRDEAEGERRADEPALRPLSRIMAKTSGGGVLMVEPAHRSTSQLLSRIRDQLFENEIVSDQQTSLWGPCLHAGRCPLGSGRDWCHFSIPTEIPGEWFAFFSKGLGSERLWLKFSYLWVAAPKFPAPTVKADQRRVISDSLTKGHKAPMVLICEPERPGRWFAKVGSLVRRGDLIQIKNERPGWPPFGSQRRDRQAKKD